MPKLLLPDSGSGISESNNFQKSVFENLDIYREIIKLIYKFQLNFQMRHVATCDSAEKYLETLY